MPFGTQNLKAKFGGVDIIDVVGWSIDDGGDTASYRSSDTSGGTGRVASWNDVTAEVEALQDTTTKITSQLKKGDTGVLALFEDGTLNWSFEVIVLGITVNESADSNDPLTYTIRFGWAAQTGALTRPG